MTSLLSARQALLFCPRRRMGSTRSRGKVSIGRLRPGTPARSRAFSGHLFASSMARLTFPEFRRIENVMPRFRAGSACFACLLLVLIVGLPVLAYASPPDPSWGHG